MAWIISLREGRESIFTILSALFYGYQRPWPRDSGISCVRTVLSPVRFPRTRTCFLFFAFASLGLKGKHEGGREKKGDRDRERCGGPRDQWIESHSCLFRSLVSLDIKPPPHDRPSYPFLPAHIWNHQGLSAEADNARTGRHSRVPNTLELDVGRSPHFSLFWGAPPWSESPLPPSSRASSPTSSLPPRQMESQVCVRIPARQGKQKASNWDAEIKNRINRNWKVWVSISFLVHFVFTFPPVNCCTYRVSPN